MLSYKSAVTQGRLVKLTVSFKKTKCSNTYVCVHLSFFQFVQFSFSVLC